MGTPKHLSLKERLENNILFVIVGVLLTTIPATIGVVDYFSSQKAQRLQDQIAQLESNHQSQITQIQQEHEIEINEIESQLASIRRRMGDEEFLDVRTFVIPGDQSATISNNAKFFIDDGFYASDDTEHWSYSLTTELGLTELLTGQSPSEYSELLKTPVHLWKGFDNLPVIGNDLYKFVFPYVSVQRITYEQWAELLGKALPLVDNEISITENEDLQEFLETSDQIFRGDAVGTFFSLILYFQYLNSVSYPNISFELIETQKVGNVLYAQWLLTLRDITVDKSEFSNYFIRQELVLVSTPSDFFVINTSVPSPEPLPRDDYFKWVTSWFSDLAILVD